MREAAARGGGVPPAPALCFGGYKGREQAGLVTLAMARDSDTFRSPNPVLITPSGGARSWQVLGMGTVSPQIPIFGPFFGL